MIYAEVMLGINLLLWGTLCTITDFQKGIIPNRYIMYGIGVAIPIHIALLIMGEAPYYPNWLLNMVIANLLSLGMALKRMWAPGDAKLFFLMYLCVPPRLIDQGILSLSVVPYILIFIPALCGALADTLIRMIRKEPAKKNIVHWKKWITSGLMAMTEATTFFYALRYIAPDFVIKNQLFCSALMVCYAYFCASTAILKKKAALIMHATALLVLLIMNRGMIYAPRWSSYLILLILLCVQHFVSMYNYQQIRTCDVRAGMIPAMETVFMFQTSKVPSLPMNATEEMGAKITEEEATAIRRWESSSKGQSTIWIVRKIPFALYILIGFISLLIIRFIGVI